MSDRVRLFRPGAETFDRETGATVPGVPLVLYEGMARVRPVAQASGTEEQAGEREVRLLDYEVALPFATELPAGERVAPGDQVEVLASQDPRMPGLTLWVTGAEVSGTASAWRIRTEDRT